MIEFGAHSGRIREVLQDPIEGSQPYSGLMARLQAGLGRVLVETGVGPLRGLARAGRRSA